MYKKSQTSLPFRELTYPTKPEKGHHLQKCWLVRGYLSWLHISSSSNFPFHMFLVFVRLKVPPFCPGAHGTRTTRKGEGALEQLSQSKMLPWKREASKTIDMIHMFAHVCLGWLGGSWWLFPYESWCFKKVTSKWKLALGIDKERTSDSRKKNGSDCKNCSWSFALLILRWKRW